MAECFTRSGSRRTRPISNMEKRAIMQPQKALLSETGFAADSLSTPGEALAAFFQCVTVAAPGVETVARDDSRGRILASRVVADGDYPGASRSSMDGFAIAAIGTPG